MKSNTIILIVLFLFTSGNGAEGQTFGELVQLCRNKFSSMDVLSGAIDIIQEKPEAVSCSRKLVFSDNRHTPWRLLVLPESRMELFLIDDSLYVFMHNTQVYYCNTDTIALLRFISYLDVISSITLARKTNLGAMDTTLNPTEITIDKGNGLKEVTITSRDDPGVGLTDFVFIMGFNVNTRSPLYASTSYRFLGDLIREDVLLDTVYNGPAEVDYAYGRVREMIKSYSFADFENIQPEPKKIFSFFDVAKGLEYVNQAPEDSKYYLVDIYFTNCGPCMRALSHLKSLLQESPPGTLSVISVSTLDAKEKIEKYNERNMIKYSSAMARPEFITKTIGEVTYPTFFLFDSNGNLLLDSYGFYPEFFDKLREMISK